MRNLDNILILSGGNKMRGNIAAVFIVVSLSGCTTAAKQVLGDNATPINPTRAERLDAGKLYRVKSDGTTYQLCKEDMNNRAVKAIGIKEVENSSETIEDKISGENITVEIPGVPALHMPYYKTKVDGYVVTKTSWPDDGDFYTYVRSGVGKKCRGYIDKGNVLIVEAEARAKKSSQVFKGPIDKAALGVVSVSGLGGETTVRAPSNVTFGIIAAKK
jgi:hypothetical protein